MRSMKRKRRHVRFKEPINIINLIWYGPIAFGDTKHIASLTYAIILDTRAAYV